MLPIVEIGDEILSHVLANYKIRTNIFKTYSPSLLVLHLVCSRLGVNR
jgi:hypothetical protein